MEVKGIYEYLLYALSLVEDIEGTAVECGFGNGISAEIITKAINSNDYKDRDIWLLDSFLGFPEPSSYDAGVNIPHKGLWKVPSEPAYSMKKESRCKINILEGYFEETLPEKYTGGPIAFLHLDCDLYNSYRTCLTHLFHRVNKVGIILFDEYKGPTELLNWPGASIAIDEFFNTNKLKQQIVKVTKTNDSSWQRFYTIKQ